MPVAVLIVTAGISLPPFTRDGLKQILVAQPALFGEPHEVSAFDAQPRRHADLEVEFTDCLVEGDKAYFLFTKTAEFRSSAWLIETFRNGSLESLLRIPAGARLELKVVEIPDDVQWELYTYEDGSEGVHEKARIWN